MWSIMHRSLELKTKVPRSFSSTGRYTPGLDSSITAYFQRQGCVQAPLLASLPVK